MFWTALKFAENIGESVIYFPSKDTNLYSYNSCSDCTSYSDFYDRYENYTSKYYIAYGKLIDVEDNYVIVHFTEDEEPVRVNPYSITLAKEYKCTLEHDNEHFSCSCGKDIPIVNGFDNIKCFDGCQRVYRVDSSTFVGNNKFYVSYREVD